MYSMTDDILDKIAAKHAISIKDTVLRIKSGYNVALAEFSATETYKMGSTNCYQSGLVHQIFELLRDLKIVFKLSVFQQTFEYTEGKITTNFSLVAGAEIPNLSLKIHRNENSYRKVTTKMKHSSPDNIFEELKNYKKISKDNIIRKSSPMSNVFFYFDCKSYINKFGNITLIDLASFQDSKELELENKFIKTSTIEAIKTRFPHLVTNKNDERKEIIKFYTQMKSINEEIHKNIKELIQLIKKQLTEKTKNEENTSKDNKANLETVFALISPPPTYWIFLFDVDFKDNPRARHDAIRIINTANIAMTTWETEKNIRFI